MDAIERQLTAERSRPARYISAARVAHDFGDGFVAAPPIYLAAIGLGPLKISIVATLALLGSAGMTSGIGFLGARVDQRALLMAASGLMVATGLALAASGTYAIVVVALVGVVNPSSGSVSMFVPVACRRCRAKPEGGRGPVLHRRGLAGELRI
jgi:hypothetical protein